MKNTDRWDERICRSAHPIRSSHPPIPEIRVLEDAAQWEACRLKRMVLERYENQEGQFA
jgi:hypothetical protein